MVNPFLNAFVPTCPAVNCSTLLSKSTTPLLRPLENLTLWYKAFARWHYAVDVRRTRPRFLGYAKYFQPLFPSLFIIGVLITKVLKTP